MRIDIIGPRRFAVTAKPLAPLDDAKQLAPLEPAELAARGTPLFHCRRRCSSKRVRRVFDVMNCVSF